MERVGFKDVEMAACLLALTGLLQDRNSIGDRGAEMIAERLGVNETLLELHLVRRFYHYIALDVYYGESGFQGIRVGCVFVRLKSARSYWCAAGWQ